MPKTLDEVEEEKLQDKEQSGEGKGEGFGEGKESNVSFEEQEFHAIGSPETVKGLSISEQIDELGQWVKSFPVEEQESILERFQRARGISGDLARQAELREAQEEFEELTEELQGLNQRDILIRIASTLSTELNTISNLLQVISTTQSNVLSNLITIANQTSPLTQISVSGVESIDDPNSAQRIIPTGTRTRFIFIRASSTNDSDIAFGDNGADPTSGFILRPGEEISLSINLADRPLFMASEEAGEEIELLGLV